MIRSRPLTRVAIEESAKELVDGFVTLSLDKVAPRLADRVWMLLGDTFALYPRDALLAELERRKAQPIWAIPEDVHSYAWADLRAQMPAHFAGAWESQLDLGGRIVCTMFLDSPRKPIGRLMVVMGPSPRGDYWAETLPLPSLDVAIAGSKKPSLAEEDWVRFADRIARPYWYGASTQLRALRNQMMDRIWVDAGPKVAEEVITDVGARPFDPERLDTAFLGTQAAPFADLDRSTGRSLAREIERTAKDLWYAPLEALKPKLAVTELGQLDPESQRPKASGRLISLMLRKVEIDQRSLERDHWRLAGLWRAG
jgi:hypothetical protein